MHFPVSFLQLDFHIIQVQGYRDWDTSCMQLSQPETLCVFVLKIKNQKHTLFVLQHQY